MAGPQDIQRLPKGLIDLVGMRATGQTPSQLAQLVAGEIDLKQEYLLDRLQVGTWTSGIALPAVGDIRVSGPAPGVQWYVFGVSGTAGPVAAAATLQFAFGVNRGTQLGQNLILPGCASPLLVAGAVFQFGHYFENPMILRAGDGWGIKTVVHTGAPAVTPTGHVYYAEIGV
jgi:hypothetical protein